MMDSFSFIQDGEQQQPVAFKLATVEIVSGGNAYIKFDGEDSPSLKPYKRLGSYSPSSKDRVLLAVVSGTYVILGKVI